MAVTEEELQAVAVAPRVTKEDVLASIENEEFLYTKTLTFCVLTLKNGFTVTGESACASPANYNKEIGDRLAKENAINKIWSHLGFELRTKLTLIEKAGKPFGKITEMGDPITYVGLSIVHAMPMTRGDYYAMRGLVVPPSEDAEDNGYVIQEGRTQHLNWKPHDVFEAIYNIDMRLRQQPKDLIDSLVDERDDLRQRVAEVTNLMHSPSFDLLTPEQQADYHLQLRAMNMYLDVLETRVSRVQ